MLKIYTYYLLITSAIIALSSLSICSEIELKKFQKEAIVASYAPQHSLSNLLCGLFKRREQRWPDIGYSQLSLQAHTMKRNRLIEIGDKIPDQVKNLYILGCYTGGKSCCFPLCCFACCCGGCPDITIQPHPLKIPIPISVISGTFRKAHQDKSLTHFTVSYQSENQHKGYVYIITLTKNYHTTSSSDNSSTIERSFASIQIKRVKESQKSSDSQDIL